MDEIERGPDIDAAAGADTLIGVLHQATEAGYGTQLMARQDGQLECAACGRHSDAERFLAAGYRRLEGASDAADMMLVAWGRCPHCGQGGTVILGYGPNAGPSDEAVLASIDLDAAADDPGGPSFDP